MTVTVHRLSTDAEETMASRDGEFERFVSAIRQDSFEVKKLPFLVRKHEFGVWKCIQQHRRRKWFLPQERETIFLLCDRFPKLGLALRLMRYGIVTGYTVQYMLVETRQHDQLTLPELVTVISAVVDTCGEAY
jgi:hypothetical protein